MKGGGAKFDTVFTQIGLFVISTKYGGLLTVFFHFILYIFNFIILILLLLIYYYY